MLTDMQSTLEIAEGAASNDPDIGLRAVAALVQQAGVCCAESGFIAEDCVVSGVVVGVWVGAAE